MTILTEWQGDRCWTAIDGDTYDGPGSPVGYGPTEEAAIADLKEQLADIVLRWVEKQKPETRQ